MDTGTRWNKPHRADIQAKNVYLVGQVEKGRNPRPNSIHFAFWTYPEIEGLFWTVEVSRKRGRCYTGDIAKKRREDCNGKQNLLLRPCVQPRSEPGPSDCRLQALGRTGPRHRNGQAVRQRPRASGLSSLEERHASPW